MRSRIPQRTWSVGEYGALMCWSDRNGIMHPEVAFVKVERRGLEGKRIYFRQQREGSFDGPLGFLGGRLRTRAPG